MLVSDDRVAWVRPSDSELDAGPASGLQVVNAAGMTIVPGMVDAHCHLTSPGGANYIDRFLDRVDELLRMAERNGALSREAGVAWLRELGSRTVVDPSTGAGTPWRSVFATAGRACGQARVRAAGTWIAPPGALKRGLPIVVRNADALHAAAAAEIRRVTRAVHARGAGVTAHAMRRRPAQLPFWVASMRSSKEFRLDAEICSEMRRRGAFLVTTLVVPRNWLRLGATTSGTYWSTRSGRRYARRLLERAEESVRLAKAAGVMIAVGTDFGGGSTRAGQLAWEVE